MDRSKSSYTCIYLFIYLNKKINLKLKAALTHYLKSTSTTSISVANVGDIHSIHVIDTLN